MPQFSTVNLDQFVSQVFGHPFPEGIIHEWDTYVLVVASANKVLSSYPNGKVSNEEIDAISPVTDISTSYSQQLFARAKPETLKYAKSLLDNNSDKPSNDVDFVIARSFESIKTINSS